MTEIMIARWILILGVIFIFLYLGHDTGTSEVTIARWTLIVGIAFVFLYFGIDKFVNPLTWIGWLPPWINGLAGLDNNQWLMLIGVTEIAIGGAILIPYRLLQKIVALLAVIHLSAIITQLGWNEITVRDIGLVFMTMALWHLI